LLSLSKITSETVLSSPGPPISVEKISVDSVGSNLLTAISISPLNVLSYAPGVVGKLPKTHDEIYTLEKLSSAIPELLSRSGPPINVE
jgi:hypothetical protein